MSSNIDPEIESSALQSPTPDPGTYDRPATPRISSANLGLSIAVLIFALILLTVLIAWLM